MRALVSIQLASAPPPRARVANCDFDRSAVRRWRCAAVHSLHRAAHMRLFGSSKYALNNLLCAVMGPFFLSFAPTAVPDGARRCSEIDNFCDGRAESNRCIQCKQVATSLDLTERERAPNGTFRTPRGDRADALRSRTMNGDDLDEHRGRGRPRFAEQVSFARANKRPERPRRTRWKREERKIPATNFIY